MSEIPTTFHRYQPVFSMPPSSATPLVDPATVDWRNGMLVRATNWLGDTMMTLPAVYRMSRFLPDPCGLFVLCPSGLAPLWNAAPWVAHVIGIEGKRTNRIEASRIRTLHAGVAVVLPNSFGSALDVFRKGITIRLGRRGHGRGAMLTHALPACQRQEGGPTYHQASHYMELAAAFGEVPADCGYLPLRVDGARQTTERLGVTADGEAPWLALAPGAAYGPAKQWPLERFAHVASWWTAHRGRVIVVGTAKDREAAASICAPCTGSLNLAGRTELGELMAVLSAAACVVANDSGAMHLAAGLGIPGVAIFGSTEPIATGPLGAPWIVLGDQTKCGPCCQRTCPRKDQPYHCLERVDTDTVCRALDAVLSPEPTPRLTALG